MTIIIERDRQRERDSERERVSPSADKSSHIYLSIFWQCFSSYTLSALFVKIHFLQKERKIAKKTRVRFAFMTLIIIKQDLKTNLCHYQSLLLNIIGLSVRANDHLMKYYRSMARFPIWHPNINQKTDFDKFFFNGFQLLAQLTDYTHYTTPIYLLLAGIREYNITIPFINFGDFFLGSVSWRYENGMFFG